MKFACDHCGRTYTVADELRGRGFKMRCKGCDRIIVVRPPSAGAAAAEREEPPRAPPPVPAPPARREENPFETQPISIAAVRAALAARGAAQPAEPAAESAPAAPGPGAFTAEEGGYVDLVLDEEPADRGPEAGAVVQPPLPEGDAGAVPAAEYDFGDLGPLEEPPGPPAAPAPEIPVPDPVPAPPARERPAPATPVARSKRVPVAAALAVAAAIGVALVVLRAPHRPSAHAEPAAPASAPPERGAPAPAAFAPPQVAEPEPGPAGPAPGGDAKESPASARERKRPAERKQRVARAAGEEAPPARAPPAATAPGTLPAPPGPDQIARIVAANRKAFETCIADAARRDPGLPPGGRQVILLLTVNAAGMVAYATLDDAQLAGTDLGSCLKAAARLMLFPRFEGESLLVEVPLSLGKSP